jgi:hypothetical protein
MSRSNSPSRVHQTPGDHHPLPNPVAGNGSPEAAMTGAIFPLTDPTARTTQPTPTTQSAAA